MMSSGLLPTSHLSPTNKPRNQFIPSNYAHIRICSTNVRRGHSLCQKQSGQQSKEPLILQSSGLCNCGRRHLMATISSTLIPSLPSLALEPQSLVNSSSMEMLNKIHPPRSDWYEEFYASVLNNGMKSYEAEIAGYKSQLFSKLKGQAKEVLEIGIGTGPNLKYYASDAGMHVFGVDPNRKMEKYARGAAEAAGLSPANFEFFHALYPCDNGEAVSIRPLIRVATTVYNFSLNKKYRQFNEPFDLVRYNSKSKNAYPTLPSPSVGGSILFGGIGVGEALPLSDASVDAVIGTLVMCSVNDANRTLKEVKRVLKPGGLYLFIEHVAEKDGTSLKVVQNILDPLQQLLADGCHLRRETGRFIAEAGFSDVNISMAVISSAFFINPHVYGIARK